MCNHLRPKTITLRWEVDIQQQPRNHQASSRHELDRHANQERSRCCKIDHLQAQLAAAHNNNGYVWGSKDEAFKPENAVGHGGGRIMIWVGFALSGTLHKLDRIIKDVLQKLPNTSGGACMYIFECMFIFVYFWFCVNERKSKLQTCVCPKVTELLQIYSIFVWLCVQVSTLVVKIELISPWRQ